MAMFGVIGGSGLYALPDLEAVETIEMTTPFGAPSSPIVRGRIANTDVAFLARHGPGHSLGPGEVPYRANIHAFKQLGITHLVSVSAVGSLQEHLPPRTAVLPDQIIDRTIRPGRTFFDGGIVAHVGLADPFCPSLRGALAEVAAPLASHIATDGIYLCIEGPQFSTRAESKLFRGWGASIIGMTAMPEARLAREAGLCYAMLALVTDYDVWHETEEDVSVESVIRVLQDNVAFGQDVIRRLAERTLPGCRAACRSALDHAVITTADSISPETAQRVQVFRS